MKYADKLKNFISDLKQTIPFSGVHCCGSCARHRHDTSNYNKSFWIYSDDLDNKASMGVDLNFIHITDNDMTLVIDTAIKNKLSIFLSSFSDKNYFRIGVYSKRGKPEIKIYEDGKLVLAK